MNNKKNINNQDIEKLNALYKKMFAGLSLLKWSKNHTCGRGWQNALDLCGAMIKSSAKKHHENNPAVKYMDELHAKCKKNWSRTIMTSDNRDSTPGQSPEQLKKMAHVGTNMLNSATTEMEKIFGKYNERTLEQEKSAKFTEIQKKFLIAQFKQNTL